MRRERMCTGSDREDATEKEKNGAENQSPQRFLDFAMIYDMTRKKTLYTFQCKRCLTWF